MGLLGECRCHSLDKLCLVVIRRQSSSVGHDVIETHETEYELVVLWDGGQMEQSWRFQQKRIFAKISVGQNGYSL